MRAQRSRRNQRNDDEILDERETRILTYMANGKTTKAIAIRENVSTKRMQDIQREIYIKLGAGGAAEAVAQGFVKGILDGASVPPRLSRRKGGAYSTLNDRERDALTWASLDLDGNQIAKMMSVSRQTVYAYLFDAKAKLAAKTTEEAVKVARENGLLNREILDFQ
jgi:DNA-binding CsgD family transcriptional regulator